MSRTESKTGKDGSAGASFALAKCMRKHFVRAAGFRKARRWSSYSRQLWRNRQGLCAWDVCRGTAGDEYCNGVAGGWYFFGFSSRPSRFQFEITALTAICSLAVGALSSCSGPRDYYLPWMRLWAGRLDARLSPGHHSRVIVRCFTMVMSSEFHVIALRTNKSCQKRRVSNTMADGSYTREGT